jgi:poly-gamma-glutamate synthesis protein (capsule biosynthesis protein)
VFQPAEFFKTKNRKLDSGFVAWSLGNFLSNQKDRYCDAGIILNISLTKNWTKDSLYISDVTFIPTWVYRGTNPLKKKHIIFLSEYCLKDSLPDFIDSVSKKLMQRAFYDAKQIITKKSTRVKMKSVMD